MRNERCGSQTYSRFVKNMNVVALSVTAMFIAAMVTCSMILVSIFFNVTITALWRNSSSDHLHSLSMT